MKHRSPTPPSDPTVMLAAFLKNESGQDLVEYALVAALVGLGAIISLKGLRSSIGTVFTAVGSALTSSL